MLSVLLPISALVAVRGIREGTAPRREWAYRWPWTPSACVALETGENEKDRVERVVAEHAIDEHEEAAARFLTAPTLGSTAAERFRALSIASAQRTLYITNACFAPDHNFVDLLVRAAHRGVDVPAAEFAQRPWTEHLGEAVANLLTRLRWHDGHMRSSSPRSSGRLDPFGAADPTHRGRNVSSN